MSNSSDACEFVLIGGGGHAAVVLHILRQRGARVRGYTAPSAGSLDLPWLGDDSVLDIAADSAPAQGQAAIGLGKVAAESGRLAIVDWLARIGFSLPSITAQYACVHVDAAVGDASVIMDGAVVATRARLGRACIVNHNATVDHDCTLGDDVHVAPGATLSGGVRIGSGSMIGAGAVVSHGVSICAGVLVGAGTVVVKDLQAPGTYVGTPARRLR